MPAADTDTRDRVIRLETKLEHLVDMVEKNSGILETLYSAHMRQNGAVGLAKHALDAMKLIGSGGVGAGFLAAIQHWIGAGPKSI